MERPGSDQPRFVKLLRETYAAFNARDLEAVLARMAPDVDWPDMLNHRRLVGHEAVRAYWQHQFDTINPTVEPVRFSARPGADLCVQVRQVVRDRAGTMLDDRLVEHAYTIRNGLIAAMDVYHNGQLASAPRATAPRPELSS